MLLPRYESFLQRFYIPTSRQARRLDSVTHSPLYTAFSESVQGAAVIRAFRHIPRFEQNFDEKVDNNLRFTYLQVSFDFLW